MTPDRITELAIQAGFVGFDGKTKVLQRFAELVRADALEEAVNVALSHYDGYQISEDIRSMK